MTLWRSVRRTALPRAGRAWLAVSVGLLLALSFIIYGGVVEVLSRVNPLHLEWRDAVKAQVLGALQVEGEGIHAWHMSSESVEPHVYALPWSTDMAQLLRTAPIDAEAEGAAVQMTMPFDVGFAGRAPRFLVLPQLPERDHEGGAINYEPPDEGTGGRVIAVHFALRDPSASMP